MTPKKENAFKGRPVKQPIKKRPVKKATKRPKPKARNRGTGGKGIPGVDYSGVDPSDGKYKVVRGTHKGVHAKKKAKKQAGSETFKKGELNPKAPKTPADRKRKDMEICGSERSGRSASGPGICCNPAGWGTDHVGYGKCRHHGGLTDSGQKSAQREQAEEIMLDMYGGPMSIDPQTALLDEVQRTAGHVHWLGEMIKEFDDAKKLKQHTESGVMPSVWIDMYHKERQHLVQVSKAAIAAGVQKMQVEIAHRQAELMAMVIRAIFDDPNLGLTNAQRAVFPKLMRTHLTTLPALSDGATLTDIIDAESEEVEV